MNSTVLVLPGVGNSGPNHWQSLWEKANPSFVRVQQRDWEHPACVEWLDVLERTVARAGHNVVLVAHSLGCALVAQCVERTNLRIKGALLVALPNPDGPRFPKEAIGFFAIANEVARLSEHRSGEHQRPLWECRVCKVCGICLG